MWGLLGFYQFFFIELDLINTSLLDSLCFFGIQMDESSFFMWNGKSDMDTTLKSGARGVDV